MEYFTLKSLANHSIKSSKIGRGNDKHSSNFIDKENNVLFNKDRGMFNYDPETG